MEWIRGEVIGRGSFGTVNLATLTKPTPNNNNPTSIVVKSSHISNSSTLQNEKQVLIELGNSHTNIIQYFGDLISEEKGTQLYNIFLEYASHGSLYDHLKKAEGNFEISDIKRYTRGILMGLCHVHENGFVHSDVKLQNILVFDDMNVKLADFGLSCKTQDSKNSDECQLKGTPLYMSPEVITAGKAVTTAVDIWSIGCVVIEMITGRPVWDCLPENDVSGLFYRIGVLGECPNIPKSLCEDGKDFLSKCFLRDPSDRWSACMLLDHPFLSGCHDHDLNEKTFVSPRCPFEFPDWESIEGSSFVSGSVESIGTSFISRESDVLCWVGFSSRFEGELVFSRVPDWSDLKGWVTIR